MRYSFYADGDEYQPPIVVLTEDDDWRPEPGDRELPADVARKVLSDPEDGQTFWAGDYGYKTLKDQLALLGG